MGYLDPPELYACRQCLEDQGWAHTKIEKHYGDHDLRPCERHERAERGYEDDRRIEMERDDPLPDRD